jgi:hypothetical protein
MSPLRLAWVAVLVACGPPGTPPLTGRAPSEAPATPEPTVRWTQREIMTEGLPAIASDGSVVVIAHRDSDGGRGNPNLTLIEKDRGDREVARLVVLTATEADDLPLLQIDDRFAKATAWLSGRHAATHLVPMTKLVVSMLTDDAPAQATGGGVTVRWMPNELTLERTSGAPIQRTTPTSWLATDYPMCQGCSEVCHNDAFLGDGYLDAARQAVLVVISYRGTDTCWEPGSQEHVITW